MEENRRWTLIAPADAAGSRGPSPNTANNDQGGRQRATTACLECQGKKTKCNGENPCEPCARKGLHCVFDQERDQRRKIGIKRKIDELESENAFLKESLETTREQLQQALQRLGHTSGPTEIQEQEFESSSEAAPSQLQSIQGDAISDTYAASAVSNMASHGDFMPSEEENDEISSLQAIYNVICGCDATAQSLVFSTSQNASDSREAAFLLTQESAKISPPTEGSQRIMESASSLFGMRNLLAQSTTPTIRVPAKPWTAVTDNDELVSHLISLYFCWDHPVYCVFDRQLFLADMVSGRDRFCSKFLVSAVLSHASLYAHSLDKPWDRRYERGLAMRFLAEAQQMEIEERENQSLTTVQALIVMNITYNCLGKDMVGSERLAGAVRLAARLGLDHSSPSSLSEDVPDGEKFSLAKAVTAWGLFDWQALIASAMNRPPLLSRPPAVDFPYANGTQIDEGDDWHPYPFAKPLYPSSVGSTFKARVVLSKVINHLLAVTHGRDKLEDRLESLSSLHSQLEDWIRVYGSEINPSTNPAAHIIILHLHYHMTVVNFSNTCSSVAALVSFDVSSLSYSAKTATRELIFLYKRAYGWRSASTFLTHALTWAAYFTIPYVNQGDTRWHACLETCVSGLWHLSFSFPVCQYILRTIQHALENAGINPGDLPGRGGKFLNYFGNKVWKTSSLEFLESQYPIAYRDQDDSRPLESLLLSLEGLSIRDDHQRTPSPSPQLQAS